MEIRRLTDIYLQIIAIKANNWNCNFELVKEMLLQAEVYIYPGFSA